MSAMNESPPEGSAMYEKILGKAAPTVVAPVSLGALTIDHLFAKIWTREGLSIRDSGAHDPRRSLRGLGCGHQRPGRRERGLCGARILILLLAGFLAQSAVEPPSFREGVALLQQRRPVGFGSSAAGGREKEKRNQSASHRSEILYRRERGKGSLFVAERRHRTHP